MFRVSSIFTSSLVRPNPSHHHIHLKNSRNKMSSNSDQALTPIPAPQVQGPSTSSQPSPSQAPASKRARLNDATSSHASSANRTPLGVPNPSSNRANNTSSFPHSNLIPSSILPPPPASSSLPPKPPPSDFQTQEPQPHHNDTKMLQQQQGEPSTSASRISWTSPAGVEYTHQHLQDLSRGRVKNERGDTVFFRQSFLEDPWAGFVGGNTAGKVVEGGERSF